jgi:integrase
MIFHAFVRPAEIARLNVSDIELSNDPNNCWIVFKKSNTRNLMGGRVQIAPPLRKLLKEMQLEKCNPDDFLFSGDGKGFEPGKKQLLKNGASQRWNYLDKRDLKINKDQYGFKHTGNILYLQQNKNHVNWKWLQQQNRHESIGMTENYCRKFGAYSIAGDEPNFVEFD